jgi:hypothetical protein
MPSHHQWKVGPDAWADFIRHHPELGYRAGNWQFHNFLRFHRQALVAHDAIRLGKKRFWIVHSARFPLIAFECATGKLPASVMPEPSRASTTRRASTKQAGSLHRRKRHPRAAPAERPVLLRTGRNALSATNGSLSTDRCLGSGDDGQHDLKPGNSRHAKHWIQQTDDPAGAMALVART